MKTNGVASCVLSAVLLLLALPAAAQQASPANDAPEKWTALITLEGPWARVMTGEAIPAGLADVDLDALTPRQWKELRAKLVATLRSGSGAAWEDAAQQTIFLSFYYRDKVDLERASTPLLESYILDRSEQHRIMALAGLHAVGDHDVMGYLAQRVRLEGSPRVRRLTIAALADHYGVRDFYNRHRIFTEPERMGPAGQVPDEGKKQ